MEEEPAKGTVTSLSSLFPAEEAQKASQRVHDAISERQKELEQLGEFVAENNSLINLVQKLPEELHHDIMAGLSVPFGKAAFFPGRLIHTNEFLVLLGEGYYAERTSKQTTEILKRRGKALESQVESLKAVMKDLKAEASFFEATAAEVAEGLVEIREDYVDDISSQMAPKEGTWRPETGSTFVADKVKYGVEDEDLSRMLSRIDELKKEEEEAERINGWNEEVKSKADFGYDNDQLTLGVVKTSEEHQLSDSPKLSKDESTVKDKFPGEKHVQSDFSKQLKPGGTRKDSLFKEGFLLAKGSVSDKASRTDKGLMLPEAKENIQNAPAQKNEAFTGSVVEHTHNIEMSSRGQTSGPASKPVSRFKMQRK